MTSRGVNREGQPRPVTKTRPVGGRHPDAALNIKSGTPLQLLVRDRMIALGVDGRALSLRQVAERSGKRKGRPRLSHVTVGNILHGRTVQLTDDSIAGLARALDVNEDVITKAIAQSVKLTMDLPERLKKLPPEAWSDLLAYGDFLLQRDGK